MCSVRRSRIDIFTRFYPRIMRRVSEHEEDVALVMSLNKRFDRKVIETSQKELGTLHSAEDKVGTLLNPIPHLLGSTTGHLCVIVRLGIGI